MSSLAFERDATKRRATDIVRSMVTEYGMSDLLGLVTYEHAHRPMFLPEGFTPSKAYSETKATQIDEEISRVIERAHERVRGILSAHRNVYDLWGDWEAP